MGVSVPAWNDKMVFGLPADFNLVFSFPYPSPAWTFFDREDLMFGGLVRLAYELFWHSVQKRGKGRHDRSAIHRVVVFHFVAKPGVWFTGLLKFFQGWTTLAERITKQRRIGSACGGRFADRILWVQNERYSDLDSCLVQHVMINRLTCSRYRIWRGKGESFKHGGLDGRPQGIFSGPGRLQSVWRTTGGIILYETYEDRLNVMIDLA